MEFELKEDEKLKGWIEDVKERVDHMHEFKKCYLKFNMQCENMLKKKEHLLFKHREYKMRNHLIGHWDISSEKTI